MRFRALVGALAVATVFFAAACSSAPFAGSSSSDVARSSSATEQSSTLSGSPSQPAAPEGSATSSAATITTVAEAPTTIVTTPTDPTLIAPPSSTPEPPPTTTECPYLTTAEVSEANGQRISKTTTIATAPYPICVFYRPDGTVMAATRIVVADSPAAAAAAVNQHVPIDKSYPATHPSGWTGGAMSTPGGVPDYPDAGSIYAVSKGSIAIIAVSNQKQSIKGRQMVIEIVQNLGL